MSSNPNQPLPHPVPPPSPDNSTPSKPPTEPTTAPNPSPSPPPSPTPYEHRPPLTHYSSLSVDRHLSASGTPCTGSAQLVERDLGAANDFWNIRLDLIWTPRTPHPSAPPSLHISVDDLLVLRRRLDASPPTVSLHRVGGCLVGHFSFPNGRDAAAAFVHALRQHVCMLHLHDAYRDGDLYALESKQRMRCVAPTLVDNARVQETSAAADEDFGGFLDGLGIQRPGRARGGRRMRGNGGRGAGEGGRGGLDQELGMMILGQFARVTQAAREVGEEISTLLDEKKRRAELERKERQRAARRRALDIYADIEASTDVERELPPRLTLDQQRGVPLGEEAWAEALGAEGKVEDPVVMMQAVFAGGVEAKVRARVWPFILGVFPWGSTRKEREEIVSKKINEYEELKGKWKALQGDARADEDESLQNSPEALSVDRRKRVSKRHADYLETEEQIAKDIVRTDRSVTLYEQDGAPATLVMGALLNVYALYDNRITYCQGMSDFLSPIISVVGVEDEAMAFWCFEALMHRIEGNFRVDQSGMRAQLGQLKKLIEIADDDLADFFQKSDPDYYSCFRWILVRFKRELPFETTARLWEVLWTRQVGGDDLHVYVAAALLIAHRRQLLSLPMGAFDSLLRYINDMSMRIDIDFALREGELLYREYGDAIQTNS